MGASVGVGVDVDDAAGGGAVAQDFDDAGGDDLGFAGAGTSDDLQIAIDGLDGQLL